MSAAPFAPAPGRGSRRIRLLGEDATHYVYLTRSRRTGALSLGIDMTPSAECAFACDYCHVPRDHVRARPDAIDLDRLRHELSAALHRMNQPLMDIAFAGSGEPTMSPSFVGALALAIEVAEAIHPPLMVRVFTCGVLLGRPPIRDAMVELVKRHRGEVWVKLDSWNEASMRRISGFRGQPRHEARIARFSRHAPIVLQVLVAHRDQGFTVAETAEGIGGALRRLRDAGADIDRVIVSTLYRSSGSSRPGLAPCSRDELERVAAAARAAGLKAIAVPANPTHPDDVFAAS